jgi:hypothetical protein
MNEHEDHSEKQQSPHEHRGPDGSLYVLDVGNGLYKPKRFANREQDKDNNRDANPTDFRDVSVRRDGWVFGITTIISLATYLILVAYTYYAARQVAASQNANDAARQANRLEGHSLNRTLEKMQAQTDAMKRLADAAVQGNQLSKDAVEAQLGANRPILEIEGLGPPSFNARNPNQPGPGAILEKDATKFQFRLKNTGPGEAQSVRYTISQPHGMRSDYAIPFMRQYMETAIGQGVQLGSDPITGKLPNILGHAESDAIPINAKTLITLGGGLQYDNGEFFYGELDWDDVIGFGHQWRRKFCFLVVFGMKGESITECDVKQEGVYARDDGQKRHPSHP